MRGSPAPRPPPLRCGQRQRLRHFRLHPVRALSPSLSPSLRAHRTAAHHRSSPSSLRLVPGTSLPPSVSFHLSELRICLRMLGQAFFPQVSLPRGPNRSLECARPRRSSPRRRYPWLSLSWPFLASLARALWSSWFLESREAALARSTGVRWPARCVGSQSEWWGGIESQEGDERVGTVGFGREASPAVSRRRGPPPLSVFWPAGPAGRQVRSSVAAGALHRVHLAGLGVGFEIGF